MQDASNANANVFHNLDGSIKESRSLQVMEITVL